MFERRVYISMPRVVSVKRLADMHQREVALAAVWRCAPQSFKHQVRAQVSIHIITAAARPRYLFNSRQNILHSSYKVFMATCAYEGSRPSVPLVSESLSWSDKRLRPAGSKNRTARPLGYVPSIAGAVIKVYVDKIF